MEVSDNCETYIEVILTCKGIFKQLQLFIILMDLFSIVQYNKVL